MSSPSIGANPGFDVLEDQLSPTRWARFCSNCTYEAGSSDSPDRLGAMVWGMSELSGGRAFPGHAFNLESSQNFARAIGQAFPNGPGSMPRGPRAVSWG